MAAHFALLFLSVCSVVIFGAASGDNSEVSREKKNGLTLLLLNMTFSVLANMVDPDQLIWMCTVDH